MTEQTKYHMSDHCCMDNRIFDINGAGPTMLEKVLEVALLQQGMRAFKAFKKHPTKGIILYWLEAATEGAKGASNFMTPPTPKELARQLCAMIVDADSWFDMNSLESWEVDEDHDGHNSMGWRVYCEEWGHVDSQWGAIVAVKPCFMWHGK